MEQVVDHLFQFPGYNRLSDTVGYCRYAQWPFTAIFLWYLHQLNCRGHVAAGTHLVPKLVKMFLWLFIKSFHAHLVYTCCAFIGFDLQVGFLHRLSRNTKWFW